MNLNKFTKPKFGDTTFFNEASYAKFKSIAKRLNRAFDIYWSDELGALAEIFYKGERMLLPMFQTEYEAISYGKGMEEGFENVIHKVKVKNFASDYLKNNSYAFVVIGAITTKEISNNNFKQMH